MRILVTGASGLIGQAVLPSLLADGHELVLVGRNLETLAQLFPNIPNRTTWDPSQGLIPGATLTGVEGVLHLAGEPVAARRWDDAVKQRILSSRQLGSARLVESFKAAGVQPRVVLGASAIGIYVGKTHAGEFDEQSPLPALTHIPTERLKGEMFLAQVCQFWEQAFTQGWSPTTRVVNLRIGIVLSKNGGALAKMLPLFRLGLGGRLGLGQQWMSWVHIEDAVGLINTAMNDPRFAGPINLTAPKPVQNLEFTRALSRQLKRPAFFHTPALALQIALGEMSALLLTGERVLPKQALNLGYAFKFSDIDLALKQLTD